MKINATQSGKLTLFSLIFIIIFVMVMSTLFFDHPAGKKSFNSEKGQSVKTDRAALFDPISNFTIIVIPDTQYEVSTFQEVFFAQMDWIARNKDTLNIKAVIHVGDMVDKGKSEIQWETFDSGYRIIENLSIPLVFSLGNHDHPAANYRRIFSLDRISKQPSFAGHLYNDTINAVFLFNVSDRQFLIIKLDFCPNKAIIQWANQTLNRYADRNQILVTHAYLDQSARRTTHGCGNTSYIWDDLIKYHPNLLIVLSGHVHSESRRSDLNDAGKEVHQMLSDFQDDENGGNGWLRILKFSDSEDKIYVKTYSPFLNQYRISNRSEFNMSYHIE